MDRRHFLAALTISGLVTPISRAAATTQDDAILRIDGKIAGEAEVVLTRDAFEKLGLTTIRTTTPWHQGVQTFEGIRLSKLMQVVKATGSSIEVVALNKYRTNIPVSDFKQYEPILAIKRDGQYMLVRDKGPLFVIYPYDSDPALRSEQYYGRSAWQVASITVR
jgi:hypothetical protein